MKTRISDMEADKILTAFYECDKLDTCSECNAYELCPLLTSLKEHIENKIMECIEKI